MAFEKVATLMTEFQQSSPTGAELEWLREQNQQLNTERDNLKKRQSSLPKKAIEVEIHRIVCDRCLVAVLIIPNRSLPFRALSLADSSVENQEPLFDQKQ